MIRRREFVTGGTLAGALLLPGCGADDAPTVADKAKSDKGEKAKAPPATPMPVEDARLKQLLDQYGANLTPDQVSALRRDLRSIDRTAAELQRVPLVNADEPVLAPSDVYRWEPNL